MNIDDNKKQYERRFVDRLKTSIDDFPLGDIHDHERPDFLVRHEKNTLGIEVTRLFKKQPKIGQILQANESERRTIVAMALQRFKRSCVIHLDVEVFFSESDIIPKFKRQKLSEQIAEIVLLNLPAPNNWTIVNYDTSKLDLPHEISTIHIARFDVLKGDFWNVPAVGWVQEEFISELQDCINAKSLLISNYLANCDHCWLLILADASGESAFFESSRATADHEYQSDFERTYLYEILSQKILRLRTVVNGK